MNDISRSPYPAQTHLPVRIIASGDSQRNRQPARISHRFPRPLPKRRIGTPHSAPWPRRACVAVSILPWNPSISMVYLPGILPLQA